MPQAGYLHTLTRLIALLALAVPFSFAPLLMNLCAIAVQVLPANIFLSSRFCGIPLRYRLLTSVFYLALPNTYEINANITTIQWHLGLLACLLLLAKPGGYAWRVFDGIVFVLISVDGVMGILLLPIAAALWRARRQTWSAISFVLLLPGAAIQTVTVVLNHSRHSVRLGASVTGLISILGRQVFLSSVLGMKTLSRLTPFHSYFFLEILATSAGLVLLGYALLRAPAELKLFILFAFTTFAACLSHPFATSFDRLQWEAMRLPATAVRYYFLPMIAFLASALWAAARIQIPQALRSLALLVLLVLPVGICRDWRYPAFADRHFQEYADKFERAQPGTQMTIPIPPDWSMQLTKH